LIELEQSRGERARYGVNPSDNNDLYDTSLLLQSRLGRNETIAAAFAIGTSAAEGRA
jgi:hypothetical protein